MSVKEVKNNHVPIYYTSSTTYTDMTNMTITKTLPKCIVLLLSLAHLDTATGGSSEIDMRFYIDDGLVGPMSGAESARKIMVPNMHVQSLAAGSHTIKIQWKTVDNTGYSGSRNLVALYWYVI